MNSITVPIHSFVDLVTNSSSESYICATDATIKTAKALVNQLIKLDSSSTLSFDDLFEASIVYEVELDQSLEKFAKQLGAGKGPKSYSPYIMTEDQIRSLDKLIDEEDEKNPGFRDEIDEFNAEDILGNGDSYPSSELLVKVKDGLSEELTLRAKATAKLLEGFIGTYQIDASTNY